MDRLHKANERFERAVKKLQSNLQYLADNDKVSDRFLSTQNQIIKALIDYQHEVSETISQMEWLNVEASLKGSQEYCELLDIKEAFEALCIIHGIMDFRSWMVRGKGYLVTEAVALYRHNQIQLPCKLMKMIWRMSEHDRSALWEIFRKYGPNDNEMNQYQMRKSNPVYAGA